MKAWFAGLAPRERAMVIAAAVVAALGLGYLALWEPLAGGVVRLEHSVQAQRELKQWMQQSAAEVHRLRGVGGAAGPSPGGEPRSLLAIADQTVREANLGPSVRRIQPEGQTLVRVVLEQASFDDMMIWLGTLQRSYGVSVADLAVDRQEQAGRVGARITLKRDTP